ncbi:MAG: hypothetical protein Q8K58_02445 [Acidimicrobiales bacterium]|nr:hypothetical protein [Acidimicrobiales bacterium]
MLRHAFRLGLRFGVVGGLVFAVTKLVGARRGTSALGVPTASGPTTPAATPATAGPAAAQDPWPPLEVVPPTQDRPEPASEALQPDPDAPAPGSSPWVEPVGGECPDTHPVKAKLASKIFHLPGMLNYDRTRPDRCYLDASSAEADGLRPAKR